MSGSAEERLAKLKEELLRLQRENGGSDIQSVLEGLLATTGSATPAVTATPAVAEPLPAATSSSSAEEYNPYHVHSEDSMPIAQLPGLIAGVSEEDVHPIPEVPSHSSPDRLNPPSKVTAVKHKVAPAPTPKSKSLASFGFGPKKVDMTVEKQQMKHLLFQPFQETERRCVPSQQRAWEREGFSVAKSDVDVVSVHAHETTTSQVPSLKFSPPHVISTPQMKATISENDRLAFLFSPDSLQDDEEDLLFKKSEVSYVPRTTEVVFVGMFSLRYVPYEGRPPYFGTSNVLQFMKKEADGSPLSISVGRFEPTTEMVQIVGDDAPDYNDDSGDDWDSDPSDADDAMRSSSDCSDEYSDDDTGFINDNPSSDVDSEDDAAEKAIKNNQKRMEHILRSGKLVPKAFGSFGGLNLPSHPCHFKYDYIDQLPLAQQETNGRDGDSMSILEGHQDASKDGIPPHQWTTCNMNGMMPTLANSHHLVLAEELRRSGLAPKSELTEALARFHSKLRAEQVVLREHGHSEQSLSSLILGGGGQLFGEHDASIRGTGVKVPAGLLSGSTGSVFEIEEEQRRTQEALKNRGVISKENIAQLELFAKNGNIVSREVLRQEASRICPDVPKNRLVTLCHERFVAVGRRYVPINTLTAEEKEIINNDGDLTAENLEQLKLFAESEPPVKSKKLLIIEAQRISPFAVLKKVHNTIDNTFILFEGRWRAKDLLPMAVVSNYNAGLQSARLKSIEAKKEEERQRDLMHRVTHGASVVGATAEASEQQHQPPQVPDDPVHALNLPYLDSENAEDEEDTPLAQIVAVSPTGLGAKRGRSE